MANFEGAVNASVYTLSCNVTYMGRQTSTSWFVENYDGVPPLRSLFTADPNRNNFLISGDPRPDFDDFTYGNHLTVLRWTSLLDNVIIYCGTGAEPKQKSVILRIYST